jgi:hypothetical protein
MRPAHGCCQEQAAAILQIGIAISAAFPLTAQHAKEQDNNQNLSMEGKAKTPPWGALTTSRWSGPNLSKI